MKPTCETFRAFRRQRVQKHIGKWTCVAATRAAFSICLLKRVKNTGEAVSSGADARDCHHALHSTC
eukprot:11197815-Lingulodinium_polyedra.AAC.1